MHSFLFFHINYDTTATMQQLSVFPIFN